MNNDRMIAIIQHFEFPGRVVSFNPFGNGHINDTYLINLESADGKKSRAILQKINHNIFKDPMLLMENVIRVTSFLRGKIIENGGNPDRETLNVIPCDGAKPCYRDPEGDYWRAYQFIEDAFCYEAVEKPEDFYACAVAFGHFQKMLADYPAKTLHETIQGFHDTEARYDYFLKACLEDKARRAAQVKSEIVFLKERAELARKLCTMKKNGELPIRVTHNDTKLNNIMVDTATGKAICVIDLDTIMPGLSAHDFGDAIRFGASTGAEDETDLNKISLNLDLYELYVKGFVEGCGGSLTKTEIEMLPLGALTMTYEQALRFLADYLEGDIYYKIHYQQHNLDRARTQIQLLKDMEDKWEIMQKITENLF